MEIWKKKSFQHDTLYNSITQESSFILSFCNQFILFLTLTYIDSISTYLYHHLKTVTDWLYRIVIFFSPSLNPWVYCCLSSCLVPQDEPHKKENERSFAVRSFSIRHSPWNCISKWKWHLIKAFSYREERKSFARLDNTFQKSIKNLDYSVQKQIPKLNYAIQIF